MCGTGEKGKDIGSNWWRQEEYGVRLVKRGGICGETGDEEDGVRLCRGEEDGVGLLTMGGK